MEKSDLEPAIRFLDRRIAELEERIGSMCLNENTSKEAVDEYVIFTKEIK